MFETPSVPAGRISQFRWLTTNVVNMPPAAVNSENILRVASSSSAFTASVGDRFLACRGRSAGPLGRSYYASEAV
jgi:hypothetical protein